MANLPDRIHRDIADYCANLRRTTIEYDPGLRQATEHFLQQLESAPTTPAQLVVLGAELCGLTDTDRVLIAARAVQMTHVAAHMNTHDAQARAAAGIGTHAPQCLASFEPFTCGYGLGRCRLRSYRRHYALCTGAGTLRADWRPAVSRAGRGRTGHSGPVVG